MVRWIRLAACPASGPGLRNACECMLASPQGLQVLLRRSFSRHLKQLPTLTVALPQFGQEWRRFASSSAVGTLMVEPLWASGPSCMAGRGIWRGRQIRVDSFALSCRRFHNADNEPKGSSRQAEWSICGATPLWRLEANFCDFLAGFEFLYCVTSQESSARLTCGRVQQLGETSDVV